MVGFDITSLMLLSYDDRWARRIRWWLVFTPLGLLLLGLACLTAKSRPQKRRNAISILADEVRQRRLAGLSAHS